MLVLPSYTSVYDHDNRVKQSC